MPGHPSGKNPGTNTQHPPKQAHNLRQTKPPKLKHIEQTKTNLIQSSKGPYTFTYSKEFHINTAVRQKKAKYM